MEDNPPRLAKQVPLVIELKPGTIMSAPTLGLPDLAKPFTLYVTKKNKGGYGSVVPDYRDTGQTRGLSLISWAMWPLGGWDAYGQLLRLPYWSGRQPS